MNEFIKKYFMNQKMMRLVLLALTPIVLFSTYQYGLRVLLLLLVVCLVGVATELFWEKYRKKKASEAVLVTCVLYTLTLPPSTPYWIAILGILFGLFFGKLVFGGFGRNIFNPALVGRAFIYINFPNPLTISWNEIAFGFPGGFAMYLTGEIDAITQATPMILFNSTGETSSLLSLFLGVAPGSIGEGSKVLIIICGIYLIYKKVASSEIVLGSFIGFIGTSFILYFFTDLTIPNPINSLLMGGFLFGTFFMATDPISAAKTKIGKWIFGFTVGLVTVLIRSLSLFNGGMMFAILIGNTFAPIIDYFVREFQSKKRKVEVAS